MKKKYTGIKLQTKITDEIDCILEERPDLFYRNRTDFIFDAVRKHLKYLEEET